MTNRRQRRKPDELRADPALPAALLSAVAEKPLSRQAARAVAWAALGIGDTAGARAADAVLRSAASEPVAAVQLREGLEIRAHLSRWGRRDLAHLRTWFRGRDGRWRPTVRGVTVPPDLLGQLEAAVRMLREAHAARQPEISSRGTSLG